MRRLLPTLLALTLVLSACLPGVSGQLDHLQVFPRGAGEAVVVFHPSVPAVDVVFVLTGVDSVTTDHPDFRCEPYRSGWRCDIPSQRGPTAERVLVTGPVTLTSTTSDVSDVIATVWWTPQTLN